LGKDGVRNNGADNDGLKQQLRSRLLSDSATPNSKASKRMITLDFIVIRWISMPMLCWLRRFFAYVMSTRCTGTFVVMMLYVVLAAC
jgi:hypothetical protein